MQYHRGLFHEREGNSKGVIIAVGRHQLRNKSSFFITPSSSQDEESLIPHHHININSLSHVLGKNLDDMLKDKKSALIHESNWIDKKRGVHKEL